MTPPGFSTCPTLAAVAFAFVFAAARLIFFNLDEIVMGSRWHGLDADAKANGECGSMPMLVTAADTAAEVAVEDADADGADAAVDACWLAEWWVFGLVADFFRRGKTPIDPERHSVCRICSRHRERNGCNWRCMRRGERCKRAVK